MSNIPKELYNETLKKKFVQEAGLSKTQTNVALSMFGPSRRFEDSAGKDLCQMQPDELQLVLDEVFTGSITYKKSMFKVLKLYLAWCVEQRVDGAIGRTDGLNYFGLANVRRSMVASPAMLQSSLDLLFAPEFNGGVDVTYRAYLWLLFSGVIAEEAVALTKDDIDFSKKKIYCRTTNTDVPLRYPESMSSLMYCIMADHFVTYRDYPDVNKFHVQLTLKRDGDGSILRGVAQSNPESSRTLRIKMDQRIYNTMQKLKQKGGLEYKYTNQSILRSGVFYRAYCEEKATGKMPSFSEWVDITTRERKFKELNGKELKKLDAGSITTLEQSAFVDYEIWKDAFGLK